MASKTIIVVGGVAGGMSFATRYRRLNQEDHLIILEKGPYVSFANCGLPYYLGQEITDREDLLVVQQQTLVQRFQLDVRVNHEVLEVDPVNQTVRVKTPQNEQTLTYDTLVLSPGSRPIELEIPGVVLGENAFVLRNIPDADQIEAYLKTQLPTSVTVIGAGFIGLEMVENLVKRGLEVHVIERSTHVLPPLDVEMAAYVQKNLKEHQVHIHTQDEMIHYENQLVTLKSGESYPSDFIIMAVGVLPDTKWLQSSGIAMNTRGGIIVDETFKTSLDHLYAVGDAIEVKHTILQQPVMIPLASPANRQGRQLADHLSGLNKTYQGSLGTAIVRLFKQTIATTGLSERQLQGQPIAIMHLLANHHAGYYPGATPIALKVIFDPETRLILGAQAVGEHGVDKRMDIIATAIKAKLPVDTLQELELTYAPPFGSAKDLVNMVGYYGENIVLKITRTVQWHQLPARLEEGFQLVDVRSSEERSQGYIPSSIHHPLEQLRCTLQTIDINKPVIVYCQSGMRSYNAEQILKAAGYNVYNLDGSYSLYKQVEEAGLLHV